MLCCTSAAKHMRCVCYDTWPVETPFWDSCRDGCPTCFRSQKYILISFPWINAIEPASIGIGWCSRSSVGCSSRLARAPLREVSSPNSPCLLLLALCFYHHSGRCSLSELSIPERRIVRTRAIQTTDTRCCYPGLHLTATLTCICTGRCYTSGYNSSHLSHLNLKGQPSASSSSDAP